ncbi:MAG: hypothetical protein R2712_23685 [Vicinamibacterales bacterium]
MIRARLIVLACALALITAPAFAQDARLETYKTDAARGVDEMAKLAQEMVDSVFSFGELGFQEVETSKYLTGQLEKFGFTVRRGVAGMPTAWVATWGSGKPVIALGSDIDGIPQASQKPGVAYRDPIVDGAPGHGEGHNTGVPLNIVAALAVKKIMERDKLPGTLMIWPGVAEELDGAKAWYIRDGLFKDVDVVLFCHVGNNLGVSWGAAGGTGLVSIEYTFAGETAHSAGAPWRGRSALDAVELMNAGWKLPARAPAPVAAVAPCDHQRRRPPVVPRNASVCITSARSTAAHPPGAAGHRRQDGRRRRADDQHDLDLPASSAPATCSTVNKLVAETMWPTSEKGWACRVERGGPDAGKGSQKELGNPRQEAWQPASTITGPVRPGGQHGRRHRRHRRRRGTRRTVTLSYPANIPGPAQLVERDCQRHADRPQGGRRRRQGPCDDRPRPADRARDHERVGLLQRRADQGRHTSSSSGRTRRPPRT